MNKKRTILLIAIITSFIIPYMSSSINVALPTIAKELNMSAISMSWVATAYLLSNCMVLLPFGRFADIIGRKKVFLAGGIFHTIASLLCGLSTSSAQLITFRIIQGIAASMLFATTMAILTSVFSKEERGRVMGYYIAAIYVGLSVGPFLGGVLTQYFGWRSIFYITVPIGIVAAVFGILKMDMEWKEAQGEAFDYLGSIVYAASLFALIYGFSLVPDNLGVYLLMAGVAGIIIFGLIESRIEHPILKVSLFKKNKVFVFSSLASLINYSATFAVSFLMGMYLQYTQGFTPRMAGIILIIQPVMQAVLSPYAGRLSDKVEPLKLASGGMAITAIALLFFSFLGEKTLLPIILINLAFLGIGLALFASPNTNAIMSSVDKKDYGVASGVISTMRVVGQNLSLGISMVVFSLLIGNVQITPEYYPNFLSSVKLIFSIMTGLCVVGIFLSLSRGKLRQTED
ncbi:MAG: MFS transporter [Clostridiales bacterium]|nr:MFS transporter [Clostridiales bacterium]